MIHNAAVAPERSYWSMRTPEDEEVKEGHAYFWFREEMKRINETTNKAFREELNYGHRE